MTVRELTQDLQKKFVAVALIREFAEEDVEINELHSELELYFHREIIGYTPDDGACDYMRNIRIQLEPTEEESRMSDKELCCTREYISISIFY